MKSIAEVKQLLQKIAQKLGEEKSRALLERKGYKTIEEVPNIPACKRLINLFLWEYERKEQGGEQVLRCQRCGKEINRRVYEFSVEHFDVPLCWGCQMRQRNRNGRYRCSANETNIPLRDYEEEEW